MMEAFFSSGRAVDVVLAVLVLEGLWLVFKGRRPVHVIAMLMPAVLMMVALRSALVGLPWPYIAIPLAAAFPLHLLDLRLRQL